MDRRDFLKGVIATGVAVVIPLDLSAKPEPEIGRVENVRFFDTPYAPFSPDVTLLYCHPRVSANDPLGQLGWLGWKCTGSNGIQYGDSFTVYGDSFTLTGTVEPKLSQQFANIINETMSMSPNMINLVPVSAAQIDSAVAIGQLESQFIPTSEYIPG